MKQLHDKKWLIACSGGPDSMALLAMARVEKLDIQVAHVNYLKRDSALRDEKIVENYCAQHNIKYHVLNKEYEYSGNFQAFARDYRYDFFKRICEQENLDGVLVAHQQDDLIETYLMQKDKKLEVNCYGLSESIYLKGILVYRPLLMYTKKELEDYCIQHDIPYGIDESNLSDDYARNRIRHSVIDNLTKEKRESILNEICLMNKEKSENELALAKYIHNNKIEVKELLSLPIIKQQALLKLLLKKHDITNVSSSQIEEIVRQIGKDKNFSVDIKGKLFIKSYENCQIQEKFTQDFEFVLQSYYDFETPYFKVSQSGEKINGAYIKEEDYPLTIRNVRSGDYIEMRFGKKKLSRFFIDRKIPHDLRLKWPIVVNCKGEIVLVPGLGCNVTHYATKYNFFMVKL